MRWCCGGMGHHRHHHHQPSTSSAKVTSVGVAAHGSVIFARSQDSADAKEAPSKKGRMNSVEGGASKEEAERPTPATEGESHSFSAFLKNRRAKKSSAAVKKKSSSSSGAQATEIESSPSSSPRKGVLKSSLKLLSLRSTNSIKGVQYADEVLARGAVQGTMRAGDEGEQQGAGDGREQADERRGNFHPPQYTLHHYRHQTSTTTTMTVSAPSQQQFCPCCSHSPGSLPPPQTITLADPRSIPQSIKCPHHPGQLERYGPMALQIHKSVLYVTPAEPRNTPPNYEVKIPFLSKLCASGWTLTTTSSSNSATDEYTRQKPVLLLLDHHVPRLASAFENLRAVVNNDETLLAVLQEDGVKMDAMGQCFSYTCTNIDLCETFAKLVARLKAVPALFAVTEEADQPIKICDERNVVQYVNRAYEAIAGKRRSEMLGKCNTSDTRLPAIGSSVALATSDSAVASHSAEKENLPVMGDTAGTSMMATSCPSGSNAGIGENHPYQSTRRRSSDWHCIAVSNSSRFELPLAVDTKPASSHQFSPQFVYVKRGSGESYSLARDLSVKSLRSPNDTPITEALSKLNAILNRVYDDDTQHELRDAIKILSSPELYTPSSLSQRWRENDSKTTSGYYDGLIRLHHPSKARKRSIVDAFRENQSRRVSAGSCVSSSSTLALDTNRRISTDLVNMLENAHEYGFDVLELERVTEHHPLSHLGMRLFDKWDVAETLRCPTDSLSRWFTIIEANYQSGNAYHNATHAADVLQATSYFLDNESIGQYVQDLHAVSALIAATIHDLDHPGRGNAFLVNVRQKLAVLYNDHSVLENHHVALAFQLTLAQTGVNIFAKLSREEFTQMRHSTIDMVLATDMSRHFEYLTKFQQLLGSLPDESEENRDAGSMAICCMMIKCADIANPTREWRLCYQWALRIVQEYFDQVCHLVISRLLQVPTFDTNIALKTAEETEKGLPVTMKGFSRSTCNVPTTQCTFIDMFARETFTMWADFAEMPQLLTQLESNYEEWKKLSGGWDPVQNSKLAEIGKKSGRK